MFIFIDNVNQWIIPKNIDQIVNSYEPIERQKRLIVTASDDSASTGFGEVNLSLLEFINKGSISCEIKEGMNLKALSSYEFEFKL